MSARRPWSRAEDAALLALSNQLTRAEIAQALGRTEPAVHNRLHKLREQRVGWLASAIGVRPVD